MVGAVVGSTVLDENLVGNGVGSFVFLALVGFEAGLVVVASTVGAGVGGPLLLLLLLPLLLVELVVVGKGADDVAVELHVLVVGARLTFLP